MKKTTWASAIAAGAAALAALVWAFAPRPLDVEVAQVVRGRFETSIDEDGKTRLRDRYIVSAPLAGRLARITLREGDAVDADAVVATLTPTLSPLLDERTVLAQQARVEATQAQVQRATARVEGARLALLQATNELQRNDALARQGFLSPAKVDSDLLAARAARKEFEAATEDRHVALHEVEQARAALAAVRDPRGAGLLGFALHAPAAGRVLRIAQASETVVALGTPLLELGDTARLEIVAELLTVDALQARPGSRVAIDGWGGDGVLEGRVRSVEPGGYTKVSALGVEEQRVKVIIDITSPPDAWRALGDGYRVGVRIVTASVGDAVTVPLGAVFPIRGAVGDADARHAVFVVGGGRARLTPVGVRARNSTDAWIERGLAPGTDVVVYPPATMQDGARVSVRKS